MTQRLVVLRPEPGNSATLARAQAAGFDAVALPLFAVEPLQWALPDPARHDALILTSANALRFGGEALAGLRMLPVLAVGAHTAAAARDAGFTVLASGSGNAADIVAMAERNGVQRALHLTGHDRTLQIGGVITALIPVYQSVPCTVDPAALRVLDGEVALLHSARAARRLGELLESAGVPRGRVALGAFSPAIAAAAGSGWASVAVAATPDDASLFSELRALRTTSR